MLQRPLKLIGIGYALGKECVGLKTDVRVAFDGNDNTMILGALRFRVVSSFEELKVVLEELK